MGQAVQAAGPAHGGRAGGVWYSGTFVPVMPITHRLILKVAGGGCVMASSQDTVARSRPREQAADNLRVAVIAGVIVAHTATSYVVDIPWLA